MLLLYLRLFPSKTLRLTVFITLAITIAWGTATFLAQLFSCSPINYFWKKWDGEHEGHCTSHNALLIAHAIMNIVLDVVVIGIPMPILFKLHMSREKKVGMCVMFAVGIVYVSDPFFSVQRWRSVCCGYVMGLSGLTSAASPL
jgi:hypothetical protein